MPEFPLVEEYKKPTGIRPEDIRLLRDWLGTQPHLPGEFITDLDLVLTYHCCGRSSSVSKQLLDLNFTLKTLLTGLFKERVFDEKMKKTIIGLLLTVLPERTKEGYAVFYTYFLDPDPKVFTLIDACRVGLMSLELQQYLDGSWPGLVIVFDLEKMALGHLARLDISTVQQFLYYLQEGLLASLKSLHFINAPPFMDKLMMILRPFLSKKLMDVLHIHQVGSKTLEPFFPMEKLPKGMAGGAGNSLTLDQLRELDLVLAYHSCDRSSEITKQVLDAHYTLKTVLSIFKERTFDHRLETVLGNHLLTLLPTRTKEGYKIFFNHFHHDPQTFSLIDNIRTTAMIIDLWQYEEGTWPGFIIICNMESVSLKHVAKIDINVLQQFFYYLQEAFFVKMKAIHVINAPSFAEMVLNSFRPILKGTLLQQVHLHPSGSDKLGQYFPVEALPKDVGGSYKTVKECKDEVIEKMRSASQFFIEENKKRVTESLRPGKPKTISDFFGSVEGTFKKLEVD